MAAWFDTDHHERCAGELLSLAESCGIELSGRTLRARQVALGRWLSLQAGSPVVHEGREYRITRDFKLGKTRYHISMDIQNVAASPL